MDAQSERADLRVQVQHISYITGSRALPAMVTWYIDHIALGQAAGRL